MGSSNYKLVVLALAATYLSLAACGSEVLVDDPGATSNGSSSASVAGAGGSGSVTSGQGGSTLAAGGAGAAGGSALGGAGGACNSQGVECNDVSECCGGWYCVGDSPGPAKKGTCCIMEFTLPCTDNAECCSGMCLGNLCYSEA